MSEIKVRVIDGEQPSMAEKETSVLENAGVKVTEENGTYKVDLSKFKQDAVQEQSTDGSMLRAEEPKVELQGVEPENKEQAVATEKAEEQIIELIQDADDTIKEPVLLREEGNVNAEQTATIPSETSASTENEKIKLPENVEKLVAFMEETGGTLEDYVRLNADYSNVEPNTLLKEYYKQTKSHLENDEIDFLIEDSFSFDEDMDDERDIRRKRLAFKEEVKKAKEFLTTLKDKYYDEVKLGSRLAPEQQKAIDFFNRYNKEQSELQTVQEKLAGHFVKETEKVFSNEFKGFEFKVGENRYRYNVKDPARVRQEQSDLIESFSGFLDENNMIKDAVGYHKALFTARNADAIANHFYEQGMADAVKKMSAESKNINMDPRKVNTGFVDAGGVKVRAVSGDDSSKLRIKIKS
jgi:hypothetical protein